MRPRFPASLPLFFLLIFVQLVHAKTNPEMLARQALAVDPKEAGTAIAQLREMGPTGLEVLFRVYADQIDSHIANPSATNNEAWLRLSAALDSVSQQRDSYLSGLYWYTDLAQAKAAARVSGKPILSLRLLGKLNEEFSCANSRFFRTILYSNAEVSKRLRERFILHWQSVRPAPRVTIDFGDGRKLERTLTGNSIHYILDSAGRPLDALPGLYGPEPFLRTLGQIEELFGKLAKMDDPESTFNLSTYHRARLNALNVAWLSDIQRSGGKAPEGLMVVKDANGAPAAIEVASLAVTKMMTEASILRSMLAGGQALGAVTDEALWKKIALLHLTEALLDARSIGLIERQTQKILGSEGTAGTPKTALSNLLQKLQMNIATDTVRNEYLLHTKLYAWLIADRRRSDVEALNKKVYAELFLTPASDPWLGLFSADTYMALENGGIIR